MLLMIVGDEKRRMLLVVRVEEEGKKRMLKIVRAVDEDADDGSSGRGDNEGCR